MTSTLPENYTQMSQLYKNSPFINIMGSTPIRIYYHNRKYHAFVTTFEGVLPLVAKTALCIAQTVNDLIKHDAMVDLSFYHPLDTSTRKQKKIQSLIGEYDSADHTHTLIKFLLMLL